MKDSTLGKLFQQHHGQLRMIEAINAGVSRKQLYSWRDKNLITPISRGIYRLSSLPSLSNHDFVVISLRFPKSVICLLSALAYHRLTTHIPHAVDVAVLRTARLPRLTFPPVHAYRFSEPCFSIGIQIDVIDEVPVRIYNPEKTLIDCFKFRHKIGMDIFLEALGQYKKIFPLRVNQLLEYAQLCRVKKAIVPYLESILCQK